MAAEEKAPEVKMAADESGPRNIPVVYLVNSFASQAGDEVRVDKATADLLVSMNVVRRKSAS